MDETLIYCQSSTDKEDIGMGHVVRCAHLARALADKGALVRMATNANGEGRDYLLRKGLRADVIRAGYDFGANTLIVDQQENDDDWLSHIRPFVHKLIVIVGAGKTITNRTRWIADVVIYQAPKSDAMKGLGRSVPGETVLDGLRYIIIDPAYAHMEWMPGAARDFDVAVYVGGGIPEGYAQELVDALKVQGYEVIICGGVYWSDNVSGVLGNARSFVGTMGMIVYEALACGTQPIVVGRSEDHISVARKLGIKCLGLAKDTAPDKLAESVEIELPLFPHFAIDGLGVYRVADAILNL